ERVSRLANLHAKPDPGDRNRVTNRVHRDVSFYVHRALMQAIHFGNPRWGRLEMHAIHREQFARHGADMFFVRRVDFVAPLTRLLVQIVPTGERAAGQKIILDKSERAFYTRRAVGIAPLMRHKAEPETFREYLHL